MIIQTKLHLQFNIIIMKRTGFLVFLLILLFTKANAQDIDFARKIVDTLCSENFWGRGYTKNGMKKAGLFLKAKFEEFGLTPMSNKSYFQSYQYSVNTFPKKMNLSLNGKEIIAGKDFIVSAESKGFKSCGTLKQADSTDFVDTQNNLIIKLKDKLTMDVSQSVAKYTIIELLKNSVTTKPEDYCINITQKFVKKFEAQNICGIVKGTVKPDSFIVVTAHYDHLGGLGDKVYFPGANDNASGVSLLLNLARYYAKNPQPYSMGFILFSGEEAGLLGSKYFVNNPLIDLNKIKFLINTDLAGTGVDGITVVNASEFKNEFETLKNINKEKQYFSTVNPRGKAANSDHYWFTEKGVPSFFIYTLGGIKAYHDVYDIAKTLPLNKHESLFKLIVDFNCKLLQCK